MVKRIAWISFAFAVIGTLIALGLNSFIPQFETAINAADPIAYLQATDATLGYIQRNIIIPPEAGFFGGGGLGFLVALLRRGRRSLIGG